MFSERNLGRQRSCKSFFILGLICSFVCFLFRLREVGSWAADWIWRRALKSVDDTMNIVINENNLLAESDTPEKEGKKARIRQDVARTIKDWTFTMPNLDSTSRGFNVSPKLSKLVQILQSFKQEEDVFRGIVLVRRRITALAISEVFKIISSEHLPFIRTEVLTGPWSHAELRQVGTLTYIKLCSKRYRHKL